MPANRTNVIINGRFLLEPRPTGTHRSALGFARALLAEKERLKVSIFTDLGQVSEELRLQLDGVEWLHGSLPNKFRAHLSEQLPPSRKRAGAVHLYPLNTGPFVSINSRQIVIIHDIHFFTAPAVFSRAFRLWNRLASALASQRAHNIICFTDFVKNELIEHLGISPERILVVPQGPGIDLAAIPSANREMPERFFLCVGGLQPHKNLKSALLAFALSSLPAEGYKLVIIGRKQGNFADMEISQDLIDAPWLEFTGYVSDGELIAYYQRATGLVYVSLMEGFGLPLVESFHLGCPAITSNISCLPEVAGDAALLVSPEQPQEISAAMQTLAQNSSLRAELIAKGELRAAFYTWKRAGEALTAEIQRVAGGS